MTSDLQPMYALTFGSVLVLLYHNVGRLVYTGLYYYYLSSSADRLYIIIYIGHIADCSKPYRYQLVSASAGIAPSACQPIGLLIYYLHILSVAESNWLALPHLVNLWTCTGVKQISQASVCFSHQQYDKVKNFSVGSKQGLRYVTDQYGLSICHINFLSVSPIEWCPPFSHARVTHWVRWIKKFKDKYEILCHCRICSREAAVGSARWKPPSSPDLRRHCRRWIRPQQVVDFVVAAGSACWSRGRTPSLVVGEGAATATHIKEGDAAVAHGGEGRRPRRRHTC